MTGEVIRSTRSLDLLEHLDRYPEDLRDIRRLQRQFKLTAAEAARALERWHERAGGVDPSVPPSC